MKLFVSCAAALALIGAFTPAMADDRPLVLNYQTSASCTIGAFAATPATAGKGTLAGDVFTITPDSLTLANPGNDSAAEVGVFEFTAPTPSCNIPVKVKLSSQNGSLRAAQTVPTGFLQGLAYDASVTDPAVVANNAFLGAYGPFPAGAGIAPDSNTSTTASIPSELRVSINVYGPTRLDKMLGGVTHSETFTVEVGAF